MHVLRALAGLAAFVVAAHSLSIKQLQTKESLLETPRGWYTVGVPDPEQRMPFRIAMHSVCNPRFISSGSDQVPREIFLESDDKATN